MSKSPEEYFQDQNFAPTAQSGGGKFTEAEVAFMRKYMGLDAQNTLDKLGIKAEVPASVAAQPESMPVREETVAAETLVEAAPGRFLEEAPEPGPEAEPVTVEPEIATAAAPQPEAPVAAPSPMPVDAGLSEAAHALSEAASALTEAASALAGVKAMQPEAAPLNDSDPVEPAGETVITAVPEVEPLPEAGPVMEPASGPALEPELGAAAAPVQDAEAPRRPDSVEADTFKETVGQQFISIKAALEGLRENGSDGNLADALFRSLTTVQNSASYMGFDDIRVYAERTAGIVDQGRKTGLDFSVMVDLLEQETGIIEDMVAKAIIEMSLPPGADVAEPASAAVTAPEPASAPAPLAEPVVEAAPAQEPAPVPAPEPEPAPAPEPVPEPAPAKAAQSLPPADAHKEMSDEESFDLILRKEAELQMVGFYIGKQEFTVPTLAVQEVIRYETPAKMPAAPEFVAGVINLRGKMTPLVHLRDMLEIRQARETEDRFIIVCRRKGLQIGLIIERVHTMYRVPQTDIDWGIESLLGINNAEFISGLLKLNESLVGIVSVDRIIEHVLD